MKLCCIEFIFGNLYLQPASCIKLLSNSTHLDQTEDDLGESYMSCAVSITYPCNLVKIQ